MTPWAWGQTALTTYQEKHALLEPLPGQLAEASQANELLRRKQTLRSGAMESMGDYGFTSTLFPVKISIGYCFLSAVLSPS